MLRFFILFVTVMFRQKLEPYYCTNLYEDITSRNNTIPSSILERLLVLKRQKRIAKLGGFDGRNITEVDSLVQIAENMRKYKLLKRLENGAICELSKLEAIEEWQKIDGESSISPDLTKGGLFREWEWDF